MPSPYKQDLFEDNWNDVIQKARRGLALDVISLAKLSYLSPQEIEELLSGILNKKNLVRIAPALSLNAAALLQLAEEIPPTPCTLPAEMQQFTTHYHGMKVHSYLLWSEETKTAVAFDTGTDLSPLFKKCEKENLSLNSIFLTHNHGDHVGALQELRARTGAEAWIAEADFMNESKPLPKNFSYQLDKKIDIEARSIPGHSPGGTTYVITGLSAPVAIVGDAIFARSIGGIPAAAYSEGLRAIRKNILLLPAETILCPGHGPLTTVGEERKLNPFFAK